MRILVSAYACEPGKGSEPEVGLQIALAAASEHEVWVITRSNNVPILESFLQDHPLSPRMHLIGMEVVGLARTLKKRGGLLTLHWYYDRWQRALTEVAVRLDKEVDFDVVHHATFASYWTRAGVAAVDKPFVWGPVGGGVTPPILLLPSMGPAGVVGDLMRLAARPLMSWMTRSRMTAEHATTLMAQNPETVLRLKSGAGTRILPHALTAVRGSLPDSVPDGHQPDHETGLAMVGRLVGWKGHVLALEALAMLSDLEVRLTIYGEGPQRKRLARRVRRLGLEDRVLFAGSMDRQRLLDRVSQADALLHPSLHDECPLAVAEALALGTPVVALDRGGTPVLAEFWPGTPAALIRSSTRRKTSRMMAEAVSQLIGKRGRPDTTPGSTFVDSLLEIYDLAARGTTQSPPLT